MPVEQRSSLFRRSSSSSSPDYGYPEPGHDHEYGDDTIVPPVYVPADHLPSQGDGLEALLSSDRAQRLYYSTPPGQRRDDAVVVVVPDVAVRVVVHAAAVPGSQDAGHRCWEAVEGNLLEIQLDGIGD